MVACVTAGLSAPIGRAAAGPEGAGVVGVAGLGLVASMVVTVVFVVAEAPSCGWLWVAQRGTEQAHREKSTGGGWGGRPRAGSGQLMLVSWEPGVGWVSRRRRMAP